MAPCIAENDLKMGFPASASQALDDTHFHILFSDLSGVTTNVTNESWDPNETPASSVWDLLDLDSFGFTLKF